MSKAPAYQEYPADYLADETISLMTLEEEGILARLKNQCWLPGSIPADLNKLSRLCKNPPIEVLRAVVDACFRPHPTLADRLIYPEHEIKRARQLEWKLKSAEAGRKSAKVRGEKKSKVEPSNQPSNLVEPTIEPNANSSFASSFAFASSSSSKPRSKDVSKTSSSHPKASPGDASAELAIYSLYPRKEGKQAAIVAIQKTVRRLMKGEAPHSPMSKPEAVAYLTLRVTEYAESSVGSQADKTMIPHPATWFNKGRYDDDQKNWNNSGGNNAGTRKSTTPKSDNNMAMLDDLLAGEADSRAAHHNGGTETGRGVESDNFTVLDATLVRAS
jgi:hypothetical protein